MINVDIFIIPFPSFRSIQCSTNGVIIDLITSFQLHVRVLLLGVYLHKGSCVL